jgi:myo-inositol 2-dehydrogenase/D-chiro-inositol 1-dehydrogenase
MLSFALLGCGRIGKMHGDNIAAHPKARLVAAYDVVPDAAEVIAAKHGCRVARTVEDALGASDIDAVLIASSTDTHVQLITASAKAGKAILCEKPIDLDIAKVEACKKEIAGTDVPIMIGFNRRFDPSFHSVKKAMDAGEIGDVRQVIITSRDPEIPPVGYMKVAGGILRDMTIHDFDLARHLLPEEPVEVSAMASALIDQTVRDLNDHDTAVVMMRTASGKQAVITNYRKAVYGYDQRIEVVGENGMLQAHNRRATTVERWTKGRTEAKDPLLYFFIERYKEAYVHELDAFIAALEQGTACSPGFEDGRRALLLANAAYEGIATGRTVRLTD